MCPIEPLQLDSSPQAYGPDIAADTGLSKQQIENNDG